MTNHGLVLSNGVGQLLQVDEERVCVHVIHGSIDIGDGYKVSRGKAAEMDSEGVELLDEALKREMVPGPSSEDATLAPVGGEGQCQGAWFHEDR